MTAPYQVVTSTANTALDYAPQQHIATLCDGSLLSLAQSAAATLKLVQITSPSGASPSMTALAQTFAISGSTNVVGDLFVLNNGSTTSDVWVAYADNSGNVTSLNVAHGTYTAAGATWSWDNTGTSISVGAFTSAFFVPSIVWTGSTLILATRVQPSNWTVALTSTTTKNGSAGWSALTALEATAVSSSHCYPILRHDATNACTLCIYSMGGDTVYARVVADATSPIVANWSARATLSGTVGVGAANLAAVLDPTNLKLHVAWVDSTASPNPHYVVSTYTTTSVSAGTAFAITGGGGTGATSPSIGLDNAGTPTVYLFWASAAAGAASDISYVTIASPYASGNVSSVTNKTAASTNDNVWPHVPAQEVMSGGFVPLIYLRSATSPFAIEFDNTITLSTAVSGAATLHGQGKFTATGLANGVGAATLHGQGAFAATGHQIVSGSATLKGKGSFTASLTLPGTGIGDITATTDSVSWTNVPGSPSTGHRYTYADAANSGWAVESVEGYGGMPIAPIYSVDSGVATEEASLSTTQAGGHVHILDQNPGGAFGGSEDPLFTLTGLAPVSVPFRAYIQTVANALDALGVQWSATACIYPGDPGLIALRFDLHNPGGSAIALAGSDGLEIALIGSLEQTDSTWAPANGGYGTLAGSDTVGWPSSLTSIEPDYVYIVPATGGNTSLGQATVKKTSLPGLGWSNLQVQYLQNASRLKLKVQGDISSIAAGATQTFYFLQVLRRSLTAADVRAIAGDYLNPGTPTMTAGSFTAFSYDEALYVFAASAGNTLGVTLDLSPAHVTTRFKPRLKLIGWTGGAPILAWGGSALTAGVDYRHYEDTTTHVCYLQLYFDVVASGAALGQRNNAALTVQPSVVTGAATLHGQGKFSAVGVEAFVGVATLHGKGSFAATGVQLVFGAATLKGKGAFAATAHETVAGAATLHGQGAFTATSRQVILGAATLAGQGKFSAVGVQVITAAATLKGKGSYSTVGVEGFAGAATLHGQGKFAATGHQIVTGAATLHGQGRFAVSSLEVVGGAATLHGQGTYGARGIQVVSKAALLAGQGRFTAAGVQVVPGAATLHGQGRFAAAGLQTLRGAAALHGQGAFVASVARPPAPVGVSLAVGVGAPVGVALATDS